MASAKSKTDPKQPGDEPTTPPAPNDALQAEASGTPELKEDIDAAPGSEPLPDAPVADNTAQADVETPHQDNDQVPPRPFGMPTAIEVVAKCEQFRRAGRVFGREPVRIPLTELDEAQAKALRDEPMLVITLAAPQED
ncbi:hypothetical protein OL229_09185 [Neisseriaceae bacterium JH1-16]|nr:hypothetical protein [Neisseriaceae bacterium JH1-16]